MVCLVKKVRPCAPTHGATPSNQRAVEKLGGMEFFDVHFSYLDNETLEEFFVNVPEQGGSQSLKV
jgi:predicted ATP-dependent Lon-type protease